MATPKEIRTKIASVKSTQKITSAMEMVAASKMRRAQEQVTASRPYAEKIREVIGNLAQANPEYRHPYLQEREVKRGGILIVSTDRGLCGGLNNNLFKVVVRQMREWHQADIETELGVLGSKGTGFFRRLGGNIVAQADGLGDSPVLADLLGSVTVMLQAFREGRIDRLYVAHNVFVNTMTQQPTLKQVLPLPPGDPVPQQRVWDYMYEPDAREVLDALLTRYVESSVYQAVVENAACEQAARMVAMKAATDNADNLIDEMQLIYNKARQAAITKELSEIVAGAEAV